MLGERTPEEGRDKSGAGAGRDTSGLTRLLDQSDLAGLLGCSRQKVSQMESAGELFEPRGRVGARRKYRSDDYELWIDAGQPNREDFRRILADREGGPDTKPARRKGRRGVGRTEQGGSR